MPPRSRRVELSADDVDALRLVSPFAERASVEWRRPVLELIHVIDGLAYATDAYRLAFAEVDCQDLYLPASCAEWLPLDGCTLTITEGGNATFVTWDTEDGLVGGSYRTDLGFLPASALGTMTTRKTKQSFKGRGGLTAEPRYRPTFVGPEPCALIITPDGARQVWLNHKMLAGTLKQLSDDYSVAFSDKPIGPVWFFDEDLTVLVMPVRPSQDLYLASEAA